MGALVGGVNGMVMSRVVGNGKGAMQEVGGVMGVMDGFSASFEENGVGMSNRGGRRRRRGVSISSAEGNSVFGGSVRGGSRSRSASRSGSWSRSGSGSRSRSRSRSGTRSRSMSVEIVENPHNARRPNLLNPSPPIDATTPDDVRELEAR